MVETVSNITIGDLEKLKGYIEEKTKSPYEVKRLRNKEHLLILYTTGKLVVQGENSPFRADNKKQDTNNPSSIQKSIGSDETLKGDTFGGLIVCGAYFEQGEVDVGDSKKYSEKEIITLAVDLLYKFPERFLIKELTPQQYNQFYAELGSQTAILNTLHQEIGIELKKKYNALQVVDKYPGCTVGDIAESKAESKHTSVAAASIIARYKAIEQFKELSKTAGYTLPKGSTHVKEALLELKKRKLRVDLYCKVHFSTVRNM